jgi:phosphoribosylformylglycinamidine synthase
LESEDRIAFRYATPAGEITCEANPNGSLGNIAGILNEGRNVLGMMPHPDRSSERMLGSADGWKIFESMIEALAAK